MSTIAKLIAELEREAQTTRRMLERVPTDKFDWKPHAKSMTVKSLATHIAEIPMWIGLTLNTPELDFAVTPYKPVDINSHEELMNYFETSLNEGKAELQKAREEQLAEPWTMRTGDIIHVSASKEDMLRGTYCQIVHHRAQMGVYLRLLNIPIPGSYGPSADELELAAAQAN